VSNKTGGTLNYHLGDVTNGSSPGTGDNRINGVDMSLLGTNYWSSLAPSDPVNYLDVGPTTDRSPNGRPTTDNLVEFEDLMMFAMNFAMVSLIAGPVPFETPDLGLVVDAVSGDILRTHVMLTGNRQSVKGLHTAVSYDPAVLELSGVTRGSLIAGQGSQVFFADAGSGGQVKVDLAAIGSGATLRGSGEVAVVEFRVVGSGNTTPGLAAADLRDKSNRVLGRKKEPRQDDTLVSKAPASPAFGAYPNPFTGTTEIALSIPVAGQVSLKVYDVSGRLVTTLVDRVLEAGSHRIAWDGRGDSGSKVAPGLYMAVASTGDREMTRKLFMLP
jgi:hypothetical protein